MGDISNNCDIDLKHLAPSRDVVKEVEVSVSSCQEIVGHEEEEDVALGVDLGGGLLSLQ